MMNKNNLLPICLVVTAVTVGATMSVRAQNTVSCEDQAGLINARAALLSNLKDSGDKRYKTIRKKWDNRISYAGQWVKGDAEDARKHLYTYDDRHRALNAEVDRQIGIYNALQQKPLVCTDDAAKKAVTEKLKSVEADQVTLEKVKKDETKHASGDFKKSTDKMIKALAKAKSNNPAPKEGKLEVKPY